MSSKNAEQTDEYIIYHLVEARSDISSLLRRVSALEAESPDGGKVFVLGKLIETAEKRLDRLESKAFPNICKSCGQVIVGE